MTLTLDQAAAIVDGALAQGGVLRCAPLTVAVLDAGGHLVALKRQDGSGILRVEIAVGKAYGALGFGVGGRGLHGKNPNFLAGVASTAPGGMVPAVGGVLIRSGPTGAIIGACGISGDASERDEACAVAGIAGAGLTADTGAD